MLEQAVNDAVTERSDLDWKKDLPQGAGDEVRDEFVKDVAAMANSGGGLIVFGVEEQRKTSAAKAIHSVTSWDDSRQRTLRTWAFNDIHPPVYGLEFSPLEKDGSTAVILRVPASFQTPHLIVKNGATFRAPRREGTATVYMSEREIERHYRLRFEERRRRDKSLKELAESLASTIPADGRVWFVAAAIPESARPTSAGRLDVGTARDVIGKVMTGNPYMLPRMTVQGLADASLNPRPRLRRWRSVGPDSGRHEANTIVEIHDSGAVTLAVAAEVGNELADGDVHIMDAELFPANAVHLVKTASEHIGLPAVDYSLEIMLFTAPAQDIFIRAVVAGVNALENRSDANRIAMPEVVAGLVRAGASQDELLEEVRSLALDVVNQAGHRDLQKGYLKKAMDDTGQ
ncbi:helix-turn-helix domain-containing protein [Paenarthrobacter ilicis]|uniref:AlbA family DNA-binding domain-containing protein n=1 Tax=Paenarthrobacter ilicis TaxID=43665 RepID=UPI00386AA70B